MPKIKQHIQLINGCSRTEIAVYPINWKTQKASLKKAWFIWYRFFDPQHPGQRPPVKIRGMNKFLTLEQRQACTQELLDIEHDLIDNQHYNPITEEHMILPVVDDRPITPKTPLL